MEIMNQSGKQFMRVLSSEKTLINDPKFITELVERLRHESMLQELADSELDFGDRVPWAFKRLYAELLQENRQLQAIIVTEDFAARVDDEDLRSKVLTEENGRLKKTIADAVTKIKVQANWLRIAKRQLKKNAKK